MIKILLADTQPLTSNGLLNIITNYSNFHAVVYKGEYSQVDNIIKQEKPQLLVIDPFLENDGIEKLRQLSIDFDQLKFLVITNQSQRADIASVLELGINCLVSKMASPAEIIAGLTAAANQQKYMCKQVNQQFALNAEMPAELTDIPKFSEREKEIIHLIATGVSDRAIAEKLFLSFHTIRTHRKNISKKLGFSLKNAAGLVGLTTYLNDAI